MPKSNKPRGREERVFRGTIAILSKMFREGHHEKIIYESNWEELKETCHGVT